MWSSTQFQKWNRKQNGEKDLQPNDDMARPFMVGKIICLLQPASVAPPAASCDLRPFGRRLSVLGVRRRGGIVIITAHRPKALDGVHHISVIAMC
jgi:hypothetical protein